MSANAEGFVARPWGGYEVLPGLSEDSHKIKRLYVEPGARLSLQSHRFRSELWCVVRGKAEATLDGTILQLSYGDLLKIPVGSVHRLSNPGDERLVVVEIQTGASFSEDDIVRYDDDYGRRQENES
jgi:mannose-6-phosphate isomerase-like protein (cupin superfamily)